MTFHQMFSHFQNKLKNICKSKGLSSINTQHFRGDQSIHVNLYVHLSAGGSV